MSGVLRPLAALALAASVTTFAACRRAEAPPPAAAPEATAAAETLLGTWEGTLPCADCAGIVTRVTLFSVPGATAGRFELAESYLEPAGGGERGARRSGAFATESGTTDDPAAVVYRLDVEDEGGARRFQVVAEGLRLLDPEGRVIDSELDSTLRPLAPSDPAAEAAGDGGDAAGSNSDEPAPPKPGI